MINVGIIGCGKIAQVRHLPEYAENECAKIYGLYDLNQERAAQLAKQYGARAYASAEELLADPAIDAVSVCTANFAHAEITIAALKAGKHVLCEKPMATTLEDCRAMVDAAKAANRCLMIGHNQRLAKAHVKAKALLNEGVIGRLISVRTSFGHSGPETWTVDQGKNIWFFDKTKAQMGVMADLGIHKTDLLQYLCDSHIKRATAKLATLDKRDAAGDLISVDDNAVCIYELENGVMATMIASWCYYGAEDNSTILYGTQGILRIYDDPEHSIVLIRRDGTKAYFDVEAIQTNDNQTKSGVIDEWIDCLSASRAPAISGEEALCSMKGVFAALKSSQTGRTVSVDEL